MSCSTRGVANRSSWVPISESLKNETIAKGAQSFDHGLTATKYPFEDRLSLLVGSEIHRFGSEPVQSW